MLKIQQKSTLTHDQFELTAEGLWRYVIDVSRPTDVSTDIRLPVILVVDGNWYFDFVQVIVHGPQARMAREADSEFFPPSFVVGVGYPEDEGQASNAARCCFDFQEAWEMNDLMGRVVRDQFTPDMRGGGYHRFMAFLRDELFPVLATGYPTDPSARHTLIGHSYGGLFTLRAVYDPQTPFSRFVAISAAGGEEGVIERAESVYANTQKDLDADVFICAGSEEIAGPPGAMCRYSSVMTRTAESFTLRQWKSGRLEWEIMNKENHPSILPRAISAGLRSVHRARPDARTSAHERSCAALLADQRSTEKMKVDPGLRGANC